MRPPHLEPSEIRAEAGLHFGRLHRIADGGIHLTRIGDEKKRKLTPGSIQAWFASFLCEVVFCKAGRGGQKQQTDQLPHGDLKKCSVEGFGRRGGFYISRTNQRG
jgi:hypothetical protein